MEHRPVVLLFLYKYRGRSIVYRERKRESGPKPLFLSSWYPGMSKSNNPFILQHTCSRTSQNHNVHSKIMVESSCTIKDVKTILNIYSDKIAVFGGKCGWFSRHFTFATSIVASWSGKQTCSYQISLISYTCQSCHITLCLTVSWQRFGQTNGTHNLERGWHRSASEGDQASCKLWINGRSWHGVDHCWPTVVLQYSSDLSLQRRSRLDRFIIS